MCVQFLWSLRCLNGVSHSPFILNEDASNETLWLILQSFVNTTFNVNERHILEVETSCNEMLPFLLFVPCTLKGHFEWLLLTLEHIFFRNSSFIRAIYLYECCYKWIYYIFMIARCHVWHFCSDHFFSPCIHSTYISYKWTKKNWILWIRKSILKNEEWMYSKFSPWFLLRIFRYRFHSRQSSVHCFAILLLLHVHFSSLTKGWNCMGPVSYFERKLINRCRRFEHSKIWFNYFSTEIFCSDFIKRFRILEGKYHTTRSRLCYEQI